MIVSPQFATAEDLPAALSVSGVTTYLQAMLEENPHLQRLWVFGEVSSAHERNGHIFCTLTDPEGTASLQAVVWRSRRTQLTTLPAPGLELCVLGQVRLYPQRSQYQLSVLQVLPVGDGLKALRRQQLYQRLSAEGLFDAAGKCPLPPYPRCIAVVTSPQAAAWGDIRRTLRNRYPGLHVLLSPAQVQGAQAPTAIATALNRVAQDGRAEVVIVARGGGAREDLDCFDEEPVVRAIATCPVPVITGIGHERDETLADLVADGCAHTPTAAAEQAVPALEDLWFAHGNRYRALQQALQLTLQQQKDSLGDIRRRLGQLRIDQIIPQAHQQLAWLRQRLHSTVYYQFQSARLHCQHLQQTLQSLNPEAVLRRGYGVLRSEGALVITSAKAVKSGDILQIQLSDGLLYAQVLDQPALRSEAAEPPGDKRHLHQPGQHNAPNQNMKP